MTLLPHTHTALRHLPPPPKRRRRTATSVMAGDFDPRPRVDVLSSLLNGVKPYRPPLSEEEIREKQAAKEQRKVLRQLELEERARKRQEKAEQREKERKEELSKLIAKSNNGAKDRSSSAGSTSKARSSSFWQALPPIPGGVHDDSDDDISSCTSSRRPHTPFEDDYGHARSTMSPRTIMDDEDEDGYDSSPPRKSGGRSSHKRARIVEPSDAEDEPILLTQSPQTPKRAPKKRVAARKGWKGWVEATDDDLPRDKLIELDQAIIMRDRRTRSGKSFDAIGEGKDTWV